MPARAKPNKREAILEAMLEVVAERGFQGASMAVIAERAGASAGVMYHHFASEEQIISALYQRLKALLRDSFFRGYSPEIGAKQAFLLLAANVYEFARLHQREMRFLEQYDLAGFECEPEENTWVDEEAGFMRRFGPRAQGGVLKDWPREVLMETTMGVVTRLARQPEALDAAMLREVAESLWEAVRARSVG